MGLPPFTYLAPQSLKEACSLLAEHGDEARLAAGGTDLYIRLRHRALTPKFIIGLKNISELSYVRFKDGEGLTIGALATLADVADHAEVKGHYPALAHAAGVTATVQIRNMGTVAGNICNAAPSADNAAPLLVYGAEVVLAHPGGERVLPLPEFFRGPGLTALESGEILKEIRVPQPDGRNGSDYQKLSARSLVDIAAVSVAAMLEMDASGVCTRARLALGAVAPVPLLVREVETILQGRKLEAEAFKNAAAAAAKACSPISDVRASAAYRRNMVEVLSHRALGKSAAMAAQCA